MLDEVGGGKRARRAARAPGWTQDPDGVRRGILAAAREAFAEKGLSGARVDDIAARTATSKRMIYYYFADKETLYLSVLEQAYNEIRALEAARDFAALPPVEALRGLTGATFDYHAEHPDFVRLVMVENIHHARHLKLSSNIADLNSSAIATIASVYGRGVEAGLFRTGLAPLDIHLTISALSFYNVSNRASIAQVFGHDMGAAQARAARREVVIDTVVRFVAAGAGA